MSNVSRSAQGKDPRGVTPILTEEGAPSGLVIFLDSNALADYEEACGRSLLIDLAEYLRDGLRVPLSMVRAALYAGTKDPLGRRAFNTKAEAGDYLEANGHQVCANAVVAAGVSLLRRSGALEEKSDEGDEGKAAPASTPAPAASSTTEG